MMQAGWRVQVCAICRNCSSASSSRFISTSSTYQSGHNKWSKIKHKKLANDAARGTTYSAISRELIAAVRNHPQHSTSPDQNSRLAAVLKKAKDLEIPKEKIEVTLKKAENAGSGGNNISYEAVGATTKDGLPVALIIECQTDSPSRTMAKVKEAMNKHNARLSSTSHLFQRTGVIRLNVKDSTTYDKVWEVAVENGAEDVRHWEVDEEGSIDIEIICESSELQELTSILSSPPNAYEIMESEVKMIASGPLIRVRDEEEDYQDNLNSYLDQDDVQKLDSLVAALEEGADCHRVWSNVDGWPA